MNQKNAASVVAQYGILIALAFLLSFIESIIVIPLPVPGAKVGLANLVTVVGLYVIGMKGTILISLTRIILAGFTFGNLFSMFYSLSGWLCSISLMGLCKKYNWFDSIGVSVIGGIAHNIGQLFVAAIVVKSAGVLIYLPTLLIAGVAAGSMIGILGGILTDRIRNITK